MAIVAAEAPESSSHTGKGHGGALVVQPQNDSVMPGWFSGFMQMNQLATQSLDDKMTSMASNQQRTLDVVQDIQVALRFVVLLIYMHDLSQLQQ